MCGICGWANISGKFNKDIFRNMTNVIRYRGPDDEGYTFVTNNSIHHLRGEDTRASGLSDIKDFESESSVLLGLGHRRLSIIDLSEAGHQPFASEDGKIILTFNGEIYNYIEIKEELKAKGVSFKTTCDTEVLLKSYLEWGEDCANHFNGMWAFAIWDSRKNVLFCSRDRLGAKPFYYYMDDSNFIFSSEMKQICENPIVPKVMNEDVLATWIMWRITDYSKDTLIKDIYSLPGGHNLTMEIYPNKKLGEVKIYQYWDLNTHLKKDNKAIDEALKAHDEAVRLRMRSDVPVGVLLSGGLDSSVLTAEICGNVKADRGEVYTVNTFTSCYEDYVQADEKEFAEAVNSFCGAKPNYIYPDCDDTLPLYKEYVWHMEGEAVIDSLGGYLTLREVAKSGIKVLINGQGSDETMFGYERYYAWYLKDILESKGIVSFLKEIRNAAANSRLSVAEVLKYYIYFNSRKARYGYCKKRMGQYVSEDVMRLFVNNKTLDYHLFHKTMADLQYDEVCGSQLSHILRRDDRSYMAFSLESRVPFIDYKYVEAAVRIPEKMKIQRGYTKYPLREHIKGRLPEAVIWRKNKMGWPSPRNRWMERFDKDEVREYLMNPKSERFFNMKKIRELYKMNPVADAIEQFINVELFMRVFCVE